MNREKDLTGLIFGELTVIERDYNYVKEHNLKQNRSYWKCLCSCGEEITIRATDLITGTRTKCKKCSNATKIKNLCGQKFNYLTVLELTNKRNPNRRVIYKCQCECGNIIEVSGQSLQNGDKKHCGCLKGQEKVVDLTGKQFGNLTVLERIKNQEKGHAKWKCLCKCGNYTIVDSSHLQDGHTKSCGCLIHTPKIDLTQQRFEKLTVIKQVPHPENKVANGIYWLCQCDCGNTTIVSTTHLINNKIKSCGCIKSLGEYKIIQLLKQNNIPFETQKTFESCRFPDTKKLGYFDFFINNSFLLEYDGAQHFQYSNSGWNNLSYYIDIQYKDNFKNQWCKNNKIPLKRIPYWELNNLTIEDILNDKFLLEGE